MDLSQPDGPRNGHIPDDGHGPANGHVPDTGTAPENGHQANETRSPAVESPGPDGSAPGAARVATVTAPVRAPATAPMAGGSGTTAAQLRRFIKSRPYIPMHELRRRFGIDGVEDDVTPVDLGTCRVYVGLPPREGQLLGELLRGGEVGYELSLDPRSPVVVGVYPMRPVPRG